MPWWLPDHLWVSKERHGAWQTEKWGIGSSAYHWLSPTCPLDLPLKFPITPSSHLPAPAANLAVPVEPPGVVAMCPTPLTIWAVAQQCETVAARHSHHTKVPCTARMLLLAGPSPSRMGPKKWAGSLNGRASQRPMEALWVQVLFA